MIWSLDFDDFSGAFCGQGKYPLLTTVKKSLDHLQGPTTATRIHKTTQTTIINNACFYSYSVFLLVFSLLEITISILLTSLL